MVTSEHTINDVIARLLRGTRFAWRGDAVVLSETTGLLSESKGLRPDIVVLEPYTSPVVIESEFLPAASVEAEALGRLGRRLSGTRQPILSAIALRLPQRFRDMGADALDDALKDATDFEFAYFTGRASDRFSRHPQSGWIKGGVFDLSVLIQSAAIPALVIDSAANALERGVAAAASLLDGAAKRYPGRVQLMADHLRQQNTAQTRRMAVTILANAFIFHEHLAGGPGLAHIRSLDDLLESQSGAMKQQFMQEWRRILDVNYWPIFDISRRILQCVPTRDSIALLNQLASTARELVALNLMRSHDLTGTVFQRLIVDRKFLAAFYTKPASAALLVGLAVNSDSMLVEGDWSNPADVKSLRIADFACGTGTLLSTAYQQISQIHELHGGDTAALHPHMMANALVGCDILPAAAHLTASMLSGAHPTVQYDRSRIFTVEYGRQDDDTVALGSIDLMRDMALLKGSEITAKAIESAGEAEKDTWRFVPHVSFDLVIMNPPFTRATNHEGRHENVPNPMFAAFGSSAEEQKAMSAAAKKLTAGSIAHGNAGEASIFLALADRKLAKGGMLAMVMPLTLLTGSSWQKCRLRLAEAYDNLILISIAGSHSKSMSFSADTGMAECLVIGKRNGKRQSRATFVVLEKAPDHPGISLIVAEQIRDSMNAGTLRRIEDGPIGATDIVVGNDFVAQAISASLPKSGSWKLARVNDFSLAQTAYQLEVKHRIWLPTQLSTDVTGLALTQVQDIAEIGPIDRDVNGLNPDGTIRGPFDIKPIRQNTSPSFPVLWAHDSKRETTLQFEADREGAPRSVDSDEEYRVLEDKIRTVFASASHCHANRDFQFNSQATSMQFTQRKTIGGTAWLSIKLPDVMHEKALVLWSNTTLGLLMYWWHSSKQQAGRGRITKVALHTLPILDVTALAEGQLAKAAQIFDDTCKLQLKPLHQLHQDENRKLIDRRFYSEVLNLPDSILRDGGPLDALRAKLANEPSVRGRK